MELYSNRSELSTCVTALAFGRLIKHGKIKFGPKLEEIVQILEKYPIRCTDDEKRKVESLTRSMIGGLYLHENRYSGREWPRYFWNHNLDIAICRPVRFIIKGAKPIADQDVRRLHEVLNSNGECARKYLEKALCSGKI